MSDSSPVASYLHRLGLQLDRDFLRESLRLTAQALMELEVSSTVDAAPYERSGKRIAYRNGYRQRLWQTRLGAIPLRIPKLRTGTYYPRFLTDTRAEQSLVSFVQQAYLLGVTPHDVESLLAALQLPANRLSQRIELSDTLQDLIQQHRHRPLPNVYSYLWLDVLQVDAPRKQAVAVAVGIQESGERDLLAFEVGAGAAEDSFWIEFLHSLAQRGVQDVRLVISDAFPGIKVAVREVFSNAAWQYCHVSALRDLLRYVPEEEQPAVTAAIATLFVQTGREDAARQLQRVLKLLQPTSPQAALYLEALAPDLLAYLDFPGDLAAVESAAALAQLKQPVPLYIAGNTFIAAAGIPLEPSGFFAGAPLQVGRITAAEFTYQSALTP